MVLAGMLLTAVGAALPSCGSDPNLVAKVNGEKITRQELDFRLQMAKAQYQQSGLDFTTEDGKRMLSELEKSVLDDLIWRSLIRQEATKRGLKVDDQRVNQFLDTIKKSYPGQDFGQQLKQLNLTEDQFKEEIRYRLLEDDLYRQVTDGVRVTPEEVKSYFDQHRNEVISVKVRHILIQVPENASPKDWEKAKEEAEVIIAQLKNGHDFAALAQEKSDDPGTKKDGGLINQYITAEGSGFDPDFVKGAFALKKGEFSPTPVKSAYGYHVIKVVDRRDTLEQVRDDVEQKLLADKMSQAWENFRQELKNHAKIVNYLT